MNKIFDMRRVTAQRACGPSGGLTMWAAYLDGELFILHGETFKRETRTRARIALMDYIRRHPEKFQA